MQTMTIQCTVMNAKVLGERIAERYKAVGVKNVSTRASIYNVYAPNASSDRYLVVTVLQIKWYGMFFICFSYLTSLI